MEEDISSETICRFCLSNKSLSDIFKERKTKSKKDGVSYPFLIKDCLLIDVSNEDGLPSWLCIKCSNKIYSFYRYKLKCLKTVKQLYENKEKKEVTIKIEKEYPISENTLDEDLKNDQSLTMVDGLALELPINVESKIEIVNMDMSLVDNFINYDDNDNSNVSVKIENDITDFDIQIEPQHTDSESEDGMKDEAELADENALKDYNEFLKTLKQDAKSCPLCDKIYCRNCLLLDHIKFKHFRIRYFCDICKKYFNSENYHKRKHIKRNWKYCLDCNINFSFQSQYLDHIKTVHKWNGPYMCECGETFESKVLYKKHRYSAHRFKSYLCHICERGYTRKTKLEDHLKGHANGKVFRNVRVPPIENVIKDVVSINDIPKVTGNSRRCPMCKKLCSSSNHVLEHINSVHLGQKYYCKLCKKSYASEIRHMRLCHKPKPNWSKCKKCNITFKTKKLFDEHLLKVHETILELTHRYACHCGETFMALKDFRRHKFRIHRESDFVCHYCSKMFLKHDRLKDHIRGHMISERKACKICNKEFKTSETLRRHKKVVHSPRGKYSCDICGKTYGTKLYLKVHIGSHDPTNKPHACKFCGKRFRRSDHKNNHERLVHKHEPSIG